VAAYDQIIRQMGLGSEEFEEFDGVGALGEFTPGLQHEVVGSGGGADRLDATNRDRRPHGSESDIGEGGHQAVGLFSAPLVEPAFHFVTVAVSARPGGTVAYQVNCHVT